MTTQLGFDTDGDRVAPSRARRAEGFAPSSSSACPASPTREAARRSRPDRRQGRASVPRPRTCASSTGSRAAAASTSRRGFVEGVAPLIADPAARRHRPPPVHVQRGRGHRGVAPRAARAPGSGGRRPGMTRPGPTARPPTAAGPCHRRDRRTPPGGVWWRVDRSWDVAWRERAAGRPGRARCRQPICGRGSEPGARPLHDPAGDDVGAPPASRDAARLDRIGRADVHRRGGQGDRASRRWVDDRCPAGRDGPHRRRRVARRDGIGRPLRRQRRPRCRGHPGGVAAPGRESPAIPMPSPS